MLHSMYRIALSILIIFTLFISKTQAQSVTFRVTTVTYGGGEAPKHVFALWITDTNGKYVKTINRQSKNYTSSLTSWSSNSGSKTTDGITGASLTTHNAPLNKIGGVSRIPFLWDCKDYNGTLVADGNYYVNVEFSEKGTSKYIKYAFTKGSTSDNLSFPNVTTNPGKYFQNATLVYTALASSISQTESAKTYDLYFSNSSKELKLYFDAQYHESVEVSIYNLSGKVLYKKSNIDSDFSVGLSKLPTGVYFVKLTDKSGKNQTNKILIK
ncbi:MAG TPA: DUF2271 domain-containing protein [Bacteroidales bacterium]